MNEEIMSFGFSSDDESYIAVIWEQMKMQRGQPALSHWASLPTEKDAILITTRIRDSFKQKLSRLEKGTPVKITAPAGKFTLPEDKSKSVDLSGGLGVTPFRSMIKYATGKKLHLKITMFDSNRNQSNIHMARRW